MKAYTFLVTFSASSQYHLQSRGSDPPLGEPGGVKLSRSGTAVTTQRNLCSKQAGMATTGTVTK